MLKKIHEGHLGIEKSKQIYWPKMNETIEKVVKQCKCTTLLPSKPNATLWPHPSQATMRKGNDVFQFGTSNYLIVANYYSLWPDIYLLNQPSTSCAIDGME